MEMEKWKMCWFLVFNNVFNSNWCLAFFEFNDNSFAINSFFEFSISNFNTVTTNFNE